MLQDVQKNYKKWLELAKRQRYFVNTTFNKASVATIYSSVLDLIDGALKQVPQQMQLNLPKLKKIDATPKITLPKLNKLEA